MSAPSQDSSKTPSNPLVIRFITVLSVIYFLYYLCWRAAATLNPAALFFSWLLLAAEAFGVFSYILFSWMTLDVSPKIPFRRPPSGLKADIFVPTFNEDIKILEATLIGSRRVRYPHRTYILDDGNRREVRDLAERLGARYIARPTHEHAKAGNINYALSHTDGDFIAILDADMVPQPEYFDRTLGYFEDEQLALIQLPQEFFNQDSIQHDSDAGSWHEQALFFRVIQPGKNYSNSAFWCGSPSVVRRTALEEVGGVATETITEDIHTTVRLHARGWYTLFVNEPLAFGIAPQTIQAFLLQRLRWAQGTMQLYRGKESPLRIPGLSLEQRFSYLASFLAYFESFQKLVLLMTPVWILLFGIFPMSVPVGDFLWRWLPYFALNVIANQIGGRGYFRYFRTEKFNILKMIVFIQSTLTLVNKKPLKFKVTPKSVDASVYDQERYSLRWYMVIAGVLTGSMLYGMLQLFSLHQWLLSMDIFFIAFFWAAYNQVVILLALSEVFQKRHERADYRFSSNLDAKIYGMGGGHFERNARIADLSISGAGLILDGKVPHGITGMTLSIPVENTNAILLPVERILYQRPGSLDEITAGIAFAPGLGMHRERLFEYLFVSLPAMHAQSAYSTKQQDAPRRVQMLLQWVQSRIRVAQ